MLKFTDMLQIVENWYFAYRTQCRIRFWHIIFEKSGVSIKRFSHSELEILNILTEIPSISKKRYEIQRFKWPLCIYQSIDFCRKLHMRRLIGKYYMPVPQIIKKQSWLKSKTLNIVLSSSLQWNSKLFIGNTGVSTTCGDCIWQP